MTTGLSHQNCNTAILCLLSLTSQKSQAGPEVSPGPLDRKRIQSSISFMAANASSNSPRCSMRSHYSVFMVTSTSSQDMGQQSRKATFPSKRILFPNFSHFQCVTSFSSLICMSCPRITEQVLGQIPLLICGKGGGVSGTFTLL